MELEPIYHEGQKYIPLASAQRRLGLSEHEVRWLITHARLAHHFVTDDLYVLESDVEALQKDPKKLAKMPPEFDPQAMARRVPRL